MSILAEILKEEYDRLNATIASYEKAVAELPKGSVVKKRIGGREYFYLQWRDGRRVRSHYLRTDELATVSDQVQKRREYEKELRDLRASRKEFERVVGREL
jgi:cell division protein FtsB